MKPEFVISQGLRVLLNYLRLMGTFIIGLIIIRLLLESDESLYAVFVLVTVGLGFGVMLREVLRAAFVPFLAKKNSYSDKSSGSDLLQQALTITLIASVFYIVVGFFIIGMADFFSIPEQYKDSFGLFVLFRIGGYCFVLMSVPALNMFAADGRMGIYNGHMFLERLGDLVAVLIALSQFHFFEDYSVLIVMGASYFVWNIFQLIIFFITFRKNFPDVVLSLKWCSRSDFIFIKQQLSAHAVFVLNMAFYFRFSIVLVNVFFGEMASAIYGLAVQLVGYVRQVVMGLVVGVDSFFSNKLNTNDVESDREMLVFFGRLNATVLMPVSVAFLVLMPFIIDFLLTSGSEIKGAVNGVAVVFLMGIIVRSSSEHWMQFMAGKGLIYKYSYKLLLVSLTTPLVLMILYFRDWLDPMALISWHFLIAMCVSHLLIVPWVLSRVINQSFFSLVSVVVYRWGGYTVLIVCLYWLFQINDIPSPYIVIVAILLASADLWRFIISIRKRSSIN